jgi:hypothetical protein
MEIPHHAEYHRFGDPSPPPREWETSHEIALLAEIKHVEARTW